MHFYRPQRSWCKVMFLQASVILFTGGITWHPLEQTPPESRHPQGADIHPRADTPQSRHPPEQTPPRTGTPPPRSRHTPPYQVHPPGADPPKWTPPWSRPPRSRYIPPPAQSMLGGTVKTRMVRILLECNLVFQKNLSKIGMMSCPLIGLLPVPLPAFLCIFFQQNLPKKGWCALVC